MINYLVDTSWQLYRGGFALQNVYQEFPELHFLCKKLESLLSRKDAIIYLCLDGSSVKGKRLLGDQYKAGRRPEGSYNVYEGLPTFIHLLHNDRIKVCFNNNYESDEIIFTLSRTLEGRKKILSGDKDLLQALSKDVVIDNGKSFPLTEESYKADYADKFFEIDPVKLPLFRAIAGDPSDSLKPPVIRFPRKFAAKLVNDIEYHGDVPTIEYLKSLLSKYSTSEKRWLEKLIEAYQPFSINFDIMKLNVIEDSLNEYYNRKDVEISDFLKSKIERLNTL